MYEFIAQNEFLLINTAQVTVDNLWHYQNVISPFYRLYLIIDGSGTVWFNGQEITLRPGYLYLIPSFSLSHYRCESYLKQQYVHVEESTPKGISMQFVYRLLSEIPVTEADQFLFERLLTLNPNRQLISSNPKAAANVGGRAVTGTGTENMAQQLETRGIVLQLMARFIGDELLPSSASNPYYDRISATLQHIHQHLGSDLSVCTMAAMAKLNADYFSRVFQTMVGIRPIPYINRLRIQKAQQLLLFSGLSQDEIADAVGFPNRTYFAKLFKEYTGQTAGQYRKQPKGV